MPTTSLGQDGFIWFVGVVEDRHDPKFAGRLRVRCLGYHTQNKTDLPTADLPWAQPILPITSSGISGVGQTPLGLVEGSWVVGFFRDGQYAQEPIIIGSFPGVPAELADTEKGFNDPNNTYPKYINEPDVNRLARNQGEAVSNENPVSNQLSLRDLTRITEIATADFDQGRAADYSTIEASDGDTWDQPEIPYKALYPKNHVFESESGHIKEFDDTPDAERIYESHMKGTSYEIHPDGTRTDLIKKDHYSIISGDNKCNIIGLSDITIAGRHKIFINKDGEANNNYDIQVGPNANVNIQVDKGDLNLITKADGKINVNASGDYNVKVGGDYTMTVAGNRTVIVDKNTNDSTQLDVTHTGAAFKVIGNTIDLN